MTAMTQSSAASGSPVVVESVLRHPYVLGLQKPPRRPRTSPIYLLVLLIIASLMVILPAIYILLIAGVAYVTFLHAVSAGAIFSEVRNVKAALIVYLAPLAVGVIMVVFMIKPLFAPRRARYGHQALNRKDEPLLFAFVDKLCDSLGAARPSAIHIDMDLNASAGFAGVLSGFFANRLVLTIGLPLAASMTVTQFAGVLAHEFGHFAQASAMRLDYIVRSVNRWFARVVYERDDWDDALANASSDGGHWIILLIAGLARLMVWVSRRVLWVLMMIGHLFSMMLSRQMEYDADRFSACIVGPAQAGRTLERLPELGVAHNAAESQLDRAWAARSLPDNFPAMVGNVSRTLPDEVRQRLKESVSKRRTGWFDTHPATHDRVRALSKLSADAAFNFEEPASTLFTNFAALGKIMTLQMYQASLGPKVAQATLVSVDAPETTDDLSVAFSDRVTQFFGGLMNPLRPVFFDDLPLPDDESGLAERLFDARSAFADAVDRAKPAVSEWSETDRRCAQLEAFISAQNAGVKRLDYRKLGLPNDSDVVVRQRKLQLESARASAQKTIDAALAPGVARLRIAAAMAQLQNSPATPLEETYDVRETPADPVGQKVELLSLCRGIWGQVEALRLSFYRMQGLAEHVREHSQDAHFVQAVISQSKKLVRLMEDLRGSLTGLNYPYAAKPVALSDVIFPGRPAPEDVGQVTRLADGALTAFYDLYMRLLADLVDVAARTEAEIGLEPLA